MENIYGQEQYTLKEGFATLTKRAERDKVRVTLQYLTMITSLTLALGVWFLALKWFSEDSFLTRLLTYLYNFNESVGVWLGSVAVVLFTMLMVFVSSVLCFVIGAVSIVVWRKIVNSKNADWVRSLSLFLFGVFCGLGVVLIL